MRPIFCCLLAVLLAITAAAPCAWCQPSAFGRPSVQPEAPAPIEIEDPEPASVDTMLQDMSLRARLSQLMIVTMEGLHAPSVSDLAFVKSFTPAGAVVRRVLKPSAAALYVTKLRGIEALTGVPLLVGANLYSLSSRDRNAPSDFVQLPSKLSIAAAADDETTDRLANLLAEHMRVLGFTLNLGPVLELGPDLTGAKGTIHCFGNDPVFTGKAGHAIFRAMEDHGLLSMPMGFPGGGMNRVQGSRAVLLTPKAQLPRRELFPYIRLIEEGARILHVGTTLTPTLDPARRPACLSRIVMQDLLRDILGYRGLVVAGPLDSPDIVEHMDAADAARMALTNGADMLYWRGATSQVMRVIDILIRDVNEGRLSESLINATVARVLDLKVEANIMAHEVLAETEMEKLNRKSLHRESFAVERRAITLVQNHGGLLPLTKDGAMPLGITGVVELDAFHAQLEKKMKPISQQRITTAQHMGEIGDFEIERLTGRNRGLRTIICIFTDGLRPEGQVRLVRKFKEKGARVVVVMLGYPRYLEQLSEADAILLAYCNASDYEQTLSALGDVLVGEGPISILEMSGDLDMARGEERTFNVFEIIRVPSGRLPITASPRFPAGLAIPYDPRKAIKKVEWEFGDGKKKKGEEVVYAYKEAGRYPLSLRITDERNETTERTFQVLVQ